MSSVMDDSVEVLAPASTTVRFGSTEVSISPIRAGAIPALVRTAGPLFYALMADNMLVGDGDEVDIDLPKLLGMVADHGDAFFDALALVSGVPAGELKDAQLDDVLRLAQVCGRVNRDFFMKSVVPLLGGMARQLPGVGATQSSS